MKEVLRGRMLVVGRIVPMLDLEVDVVRAESPGIEKEKLKITRYSKRIPPFYKFFEKKVSRSRIVIGENFFS